MKKFMTITEDLKMKALRYGGPKFPNVIKIMESFLTLYQKRRKVSRPLNLFDKGFLLPVRVVWADHIV